MIEIRDIVISVLAVTLILSYPTIEFFWIGLIVVVFAFLAHELAHRFVANKLGINAYFKMFPAGLVMGLLMMLAGLKFVLPGTVITTPYKFGRWKFKNPKSTLQEHGMIAFAGPAVNIVFALAFRLIPGYFAFINSAGVPFFLRPDIINAWIAFFNLIPVDPLDGAKIMRWKGLWWFLLIVASIGLMGIGYAESIGF